VIIRADCDVCNGTENWFHKQTAGPPLGPGATSGNGTGNETWVTGSRTAAAPTPTPTAVPTAAAAPASKLPDTSRAVPDDATVGLLAGGGLRRRRARG
jgi:hypothetical protein